MNTRQQDRRCLSPKAAGWWSRLFVAALFVFYLNYIPLHLATATHLDGLVASVSEVVLHHDGHDDAAHSHDNDPHVPHPASDHTLTFTAQTHESSALTLAVFFLPVDSTVLICEPKVRLPSPVFDRVWPPGESPPGPLQPRAPPFA